MSYLACIASGTVGKAYDKKKTLRQNFKTMGLSLNANVTVPVSGRSADGDGQLEGTPMDLTTTTAVVQGGFTDWLSTWPSEPYKGYTGNL